MTRLLRRGEASDAYWAVALRLGVFYTDISGTTRRAPVVEARHWAWWLLVRRGDWSLSGLGRELGRDHTTIRHGVRKCDRLVSRGEIPDAIADLVGEQACA